VVGLYDFGGVLFGFNTRGWLVGWLVGMMIIQLLITVNSLLSGMNGESSVPLCKFSGCMRETFTETQYKVETACFHFYL
jgi:hypothetical protein